MFFLKVLLRDFFLMVTISVRTVTIWPVFCSSGEQRNGGPRLEGDWNHRSKPQEEDPACSTLLTKGDEKLTLTSLAVLA